MSQIGTEREVCFLVGPMGVKTISFTQTYLRIAFHCEKIKSNNIEGFYSLNCTNNKTGVAQFVYVIESKGTVDQL